MDTEHQVPIWFFIGITLLIYGIIITGAGIYGLIYPAGQAHLPMAWLHADIWWGAFMAIIGAIYCLKFNPLREKV